jgi:hypothetical protein
MSMTMSEQVDLRECSHRGESRIWITGDARAAIQSCNQEGDRGEVKSSYLCANVVDRILRKDEVVPTN